MNYIEATSIITGVESNSLFLAGGITNCPNWQSEIVQKLRETDLTILNPRRDNFPVGDPTAAYNQILWEFKALRAATAISFWFPKETICPIVLYELGAWSMTNKTIYVGVHPDYSRRQDVEIQTELARPFIEVVYSIDSLVQQITR